MSPIYVKFGPQFLSGGTIFTIQNLYFLYNLLSKHWHFWCSDFEKKILNIFPMLFYVHFKPHLRSQFWSGDHNYKNLESHYKSFSIKIGISVTLVLEEKIIKKFKKGPQFLSGVTIFFQCRIFTIYKSFCVDIGISGEVVLEKIFLTFFYVILS